MTDSKNHPLPRVVLIGVPIHALPRVVPIGVPIHPLPRVVLIGVSTHPLTRMVLTRLQYILGAQCNNCCNHQPKEHYD